MVSVIIFILTVTIAIIAIVLAAISFPTVLGLFKVGLGSSEFYLLLDSDRLKFLPSFVISIAAFTALLTYQRGKATEQREKTKVQNEKEEKRSKVFLELAREGLEGAYEMLKDQNNNRTTWVRASRDILHALNIAKEITSSQYVEAYRLLEEKIRHKLYLVLTVQDDTTGERHALPPQFFYGVKNWEEENNLDDVAIETSSQCEVQSVSIDHIFKEPHSTPLSRHSVVAIYDFLKYPEDYDDPLKKVKVWDGDWTSSHGECQGSKRFVYHKTRYYAIGEKLYDSEKDKGTKS